MRRNPEPRGPPTDKDPVTLSPDVTPPWCASRRVAVLARTGLFIVFCALVSAQTPASRDLAIVGATLIDGTGGPARSDVTVITHGERIVKVGPRATTPPPDGAQVIDGAGKFLLPGFMDAHVHYRDYYPELFLTHGVTSIGDWGGSPVDWTLAQKDGVAKGRLYGPRIFTCGEMLPEDLDAAGAVRAVGEMADRGVSLIAFGFAHKVDVVRAAAAEAHRRGLRAVGYPVSTRAAIEAGLDTIKHTYTIGAVNTTDAARLADQQRQLARPERQRDARLFLLEDDGASAAALLKAKGVTWIPTLVKDFKVIHDRRDEFERDGLRLLLNPDLSYLPLDTYLPQLANDYLPGLPVVASGLVGTVQHRGEEYDRYRRAYASLQQLIRRVVQDGGRVLAGTAPHSFVLPGLSLHQEMQLFVDAGLTPTQALQTASSWVAEWLQVEKDLGTVTEGKLADLVLLARNPIENIANSRSVETVIQGGRVQPTGYHRSYANPIPRSTSRNAPGAGVPRPQLDAIEPSVTVQGQPPLKVTLRGRAFMPGAVVFLDGVPLETTLVSSNEATVVVPAAALARAGTAWLVISNPRPGGGDSTSVPLIVRFN